MTTDSLAPAVPATRTQIVRRILAIALGAMIVGLSAQVEITVGISPVPMTLQGLAIITMGLILGPRLGAATLVTYLGMGVAGLPVFSGGGLGMLHLFGPTGGYLIAFPFGAFVAGYIATRDTRLATPLRYLLGAFAGMITIHAGGWAWLALATHDPVNAFRLGVLPFAVIDPLKAVIASGLGLGLGDRVRRVL